MPEALMHDLVPASRRRVGRSPKRAALPLAAALLGWLACADAHALGPHEIALLVNANSPASREIANHYAKLRGVPMRNIVFLDVPADFGGAQSTITTQQFEQLIWTPASTAIAQRGIGDHLLAWVYSADFPTAVQYSKPVSIHGITFVRGQLPSQADIDEARFASKLFRGPSSAGGPKGAPMSLEQFAVSFGSNMPLPAMSLGHVSPRGIPVADILDSLRFSAGADGSRPDASVNFVLSEDVRAKCRAWQVAGVVEELSQAGVKSVVTSNQPDRRSALIGLQVGAAEIDKFLDVRLTPGCMAEHLTSLGAVFGGDGQSKIPLWIKAGAAGTAGTVTEPYAMWPKFPHARFFVHYAAGCTMLESFAQSLASPLQTFLLGDPLAKPYARLRPLTLVCLADDDSELTGDVEFVATSSSGMPARELTFIFLLDGKTLPVAGKEARVKFNVAGLDDGWHELRAIGYGPGNVREQAAATKLFGVASHKRSVKIAQPSGSRVEAGAPVEVKLEATGEPEGFDVFAQGRIIASSKDSSLKVDFAKAGPGPVWIQAAARYKDGGSAWSRPRIVEIKAAQP